MATRLLQCAFRFKDYSKSLARGVVEWTGSRWHYQGRQDKHHEDAEVKDDKLISQDVIWTVGTFKQGVITN